MGLATSATLGLALAATASAQDYTTGPVYQAVPAVFESGAQPIVSSGVYFSPYGSTVAPGSVVTASAVVHAAPATASSYRISSMVASSAGTLSAQRVLNSKNLLRAEALPNPSTARSALEAATARLQQFLQPDRNANGSQWLQFLRWNELQKQLSAKEPDLQLLEQLLLNMRQNYSGLEMKAFTDVRGSLDQYINALRYGADGKETIQGLGNRLEDLAKTLDEPVKGSGLERQREIGLMVQYLTESKQLPDLVSAMQSSFARPNVRVLISERFARRQFGRAVAEPNPVNEEILGTQVTGTSFVSGAVMPQFVDNPRAATIRLNLNAQFSSNNHGLNRGVTILSQGSAPVHAAETISLTDQGLVTWNDTTVAAPLHTDILGIQHRLRLVRRIASKKVAQQSGLANSIAQGRLENRLANQFHQQLSTQVDQSNARLPMPDLTPLRRLELARPIRTSWSSRNYIGLLWKMQNPHQLAAPSSCPLNVPHEGVTLQLHQSLITNILDPLLGGRLLKNNELDDLARQFTKEIPASLIKEANNEPWSISMAPFHPVEIEFHEKKVRFAIRLLDVSKGDQALGQPATISAEYRIELQNNAIQLIRDGDVKIDFLGRAQRGLRASTLRSFLKTKFEDVFREQLLEQPLRPLDRLPAGLPPLRIDSIETDQGWIQVVLK
jgi:hypothetical protein